AAASAGAVSVVAGAAASFLRLAAVERLRRFAGAAGDVPGFASAASPGGSCSTVWTMGTLRYAL
ncbi:MAG TPA: hypothetical protein PK752_13860, partial [Accumulibacter sp.]|uniref:hypothetical protein n=1 Tax=Accumulibacter sp. TaxID=2053492 RepID=UPI002B9A0344